MHASDVPNAETDDQIAARAALSPCLRRLAMRASLVDQADSRGDSNATTCRAVAANVGTQDRGGLAHRPAPWPELIRKRSVVQVHVAPPAISPGQRTWASSCPQRFALRVPHPCQIGADP